MEQQSGFSTIGIDGCRAGWLGVWYEPDQTGFRLIRKAEDLKAVFTIAGCVFIDIPIGMPEDTHVRMCDVLLRRVLGPDYRASVFSPPVRAALLTTDYNAACAINEAKTGKRISKQAWNITPKIREVDGILQADKNLARHVLESHPELLFKKLNRGGEPIPKKKTPKGMEKRLELLSGIDSRSQDLFLDMRAAFTKAEAKDDDLLDAMVLGLFASKAVKSPVRTLPLPPETDAAGLPMGIHFVHIG